MLYAMLAACATLIFVLALAVPHAAAARRLARLFRAQQVWAELMDRHEEEKLGRFARTVRSDGPARRRCGVHV
jgi:hypothetical protein